MRACGISLFVYNGGRLVIYLLVPSLSLSLLVKRRSTTHPHTQTNMLLNKNVLGSALFAAVASAAACNPLTSTGCPADKALAGSFAEGFTSESKWFTDEKMPGEVEYTSDGLAMTLTKQGDNPTLTSNFYIMYGRVEVEMMAAPGQGIVSSFFLQSDDLDELDIEWVGSDDTQFQSNYFSKGNTATYDRGEFHGVGTPEATYHNYTMVWEMDKTTWYLDGAAVRVLENTTTEGYPQTPMYLKMGIWAGGDPSNAPGTIEWAGGLTDYSKAPFTMHIKNVVVVDYSTGSEYSYADQSGSWESIEAKDGAIYGREQQAIQDYAELTNGGQVAEPSVSSAASSSSAAPSSSSEVASSSSAAPSSSSEVASSSSAAPSSSSAAPSSSSAAPSSSSKVASSSTVSSSSSSSAAATTSSSSSKATTSSSKATTTSSVEVKTSLDAADRTLSTSRTASVEHTSSSNAVKIASDMAMGLSTSSGFAVIPLLLLSLL